MSDDRWEQGSTVFNPAKPKPLEEDSWSSAVSPEDKMLKAILAGREWHPVFVWMRNMFPDAYERARERSKV